ncbi:MAG: hypothetical protein R3C25_04505 [Hyphomonadaceae bacterium]
MSLERFQDRGVMRVIKACETPADEIDAAINRHWRLLTSDFAKGRLRGEVEGVSYDLAALQDYVEGPVLQLTGPDAGLSSATFLLFMHPMNEPRPTGAFAGRTVDSGLHYHFGSRALTAYVAAGALVTIPCLSPPVCANLREGADYALREVQLGREGQQTPRPGWELMVRGPQIVEIEFGPFIAHSFNAVGGRCLIVSRHAEEDVEFSEAQKRAGFSEIGDGSVFLLPPQPLRQDDLRLYNELITAGAAG